MMKLSPHRAGRAGIHHSQEEQCRPSADSSFRVSRRLLSASWRVAASRASRLRAPIPSTARPRRAEGGERYGSRGVSGLRARRGQPDGRVLALAGRGGAAGGAHVSAGRSVGEHRGLPDFLDSWAEWRRADPDRMFVLNVPMLERNEERVPDERGPHPAPGGRGGRLRPALHPAGGTPGGARRSDTVIVLGWEMNGTTYTHRCGPDPTSWKAYWERIVTMRVRAVPGQEFRFDSTRAGGGTRCRGPSATRRRRRRHHRDGLLRPASR